MTDFGPAPGRPPGTDAPPGGSRRDAAPASRRRDDAPPPEAPARAGDPEARARATARGFELRLRLCGAAAEAPAAPVAPGPDLAAPADHPAEAAPAAPPMRDGTGITALAPPSPGLARGTLIATRRGPVPVEALQPGDRVQTLDDGLAAVAWVGQWRSPGLAARAPVRIAPGVLGNDRALVLAPGHRVLVRPEAGPLADQEVLVAVAALAGLPGITRLPEARSDWFAPVFAQHAVIFAENARIESLLPLPPALAALSPADRAALDARASESPALALPARPIVPEVRAPRLILRHGLALGPPQEAAEDAPGQGAAPGHGPAPRRA